ncbi:MAG: hypothetical protein NC337_03855 [Roseburia sp.]|nr:hypothetical protein [Roseburia sp.]
MEENSNVYRTKSENEEVQQPDGAAQSSVYGGQSGTPSFAEIVQQGPANYRSPNASPQQSFGQSPNASPQQPFGQSPNANPQQPFGQSPNANPQPPFGQQAGFGGQINPPQPPYGQQPNPGLQYEKPKKNRTAGIVIAVIAVLVVLVGGVGAFLLLRGSFQSKDPEKMLQQALELRQKENEAYTAALDELLGMTAVRERQEEEPYHANINLSFTIPFSYDLDNISIEVDAVTDKRNEEGAYELSVGTYGFTMSVGSMTMADDVIYFSVPLLFRDTYHIDLETIEEDVKNSPWVKAMVPELSEEFSPEIFKNIADEAAMQAELEALMEKYTALLAEDRELALLSEPKEFTLHGKTQKCSGVSITIGKDRMNEWLEGFKTDFMDTAYYKYLKDMIDVELDEADFEDYGQDVDAFMETMLGMHFEQDYVINVYMDSKGRIINQSTPEDIHVSNSAIELFSIDINYLGDERAMDTVDCFCYFKTADSSWYFGLDRNAEVSDEVYEENWKLSFGEVDGAELSLEYQNDWSRSDREFDMGITLLMKDAYGYTENLALTAEGAFTGVVAGDTYTLEIDNATLEYDNETVVIMSGRILSEFTNKAIEVPGNSTNIFDLTEDELEDLLFDSSSSLYY